MCENINNVDLEEEQKFTLEQEARDDLTDIITAAIADDLIW